MKEKFFYSQTVRELEQHFRMLQQHSDYLKLMILNPSERRKFIKNLELNLNSFFQSELCVDDLYIYNIDEKFNLGNVDIKLHPKIWEKNPPKDVKYLHVDFEFLLNKLEAADTNCWGNALLPDKFLIEIIKEFNIKSLGVSEFLKITKQYSPRFFIFSLDIYFNELQDSNKQGLTIKLHNFYIPHVENSDISNLGLPKVFHIRGNDLSSMQIETIRILEDIKQKILDIETQLGIDSSKLY